MTIAAILALAVVAFAAGAYAYLVYSPKTQMPSLSHRGPAHHDEGGGHVIPQP